MWSALESAQALTDTEREAREMADTMTMAERVRIAQRGLEMIGKRPSNLGLSSDAVTYRTHAPVIGQHRDSGVLERSNWTVVSDDLLRRHGDTVSVHAPECGSVETEAPVCDCTPDVVVERFRDWLVGWTETLSVRVEIPQRHVAVGEPTRAWLDAVEWLDALESYPVADEMHHAELEWTEATEYVAAELDGPDGRWTELALQALLDSPDGICEDSVGTQLTDALRTVWLSETVRVLDAVEAWLRDRMAGDGQLTLDGHTVRVSAEPPHDVAELEALSPDHDLEWAVASAIADDLHRPEVEAVESRLAWTLDVMLSGRVGA